MAQKKKTPVKGWVKSKPVMPKNIGFSPEAMEYVQKQVDGTRAEVREAGRLQGFTQGLALAISYLYKGESAVSIWKAAGLTIGECIKSEVAEYDLDEIVKHWKELDGIPNGQY